MKKAMPFHLSNYKAQRNRKIGFLVLTISVISVVLLNFVSYFVIFK